MIYVDKSFAHIFFVDLKVFIEIDNFMITSSEFWANINVTY